MSSNAPTRFRCKVGGEWKDISEFSAAQQRHLQTRRVDPAHSGMTCKQHSVGSRSELRCELCGLVKPLDEFSKSSRRKGEYQCRRCVAWIEIQEPSLTPGPLETGHISPEEEQQQMLKHRFLLSEDFFHDDDDDDDLPRAPITAFSSLGLDDSYASAIGSCTFEELLSQANDTSSARSAMPPHLGRAGSTVAGSETSSVAGSVSGDATLPPHLRRKYKAISEAASSASSTAGGDLSLPTTLLESNSNTTSIINQFNAWGPDGEMQRRRVDSVVDSAASSSEAAASTIDDPNVVGDWTRVGKAKQVAAPRRGKGGCWGKGPENRMPVAEMREERGEVRPTYMRREIDTQKLVRPIGYDDDSD